MARVEVQTDSGTAEIALMLTVDEVDLIVTTWDVPLDLKHKLIEAKKNAESII